MSHLQPKLPLTDKTILVTRAAGQSSDFCHLLQRQGAMVIEMPALEITAPSSWFALDEAIANLHTFNWLILTSTNGVDYFFSRLQDKGKDVSALAGVKIAVVGKKTAASLEQYGLSADFIPPNFVADSLVENFPEQLPNQKILFPRVETGGREVLVQELTAKGAELVEVPAYQSGCPSAITPEVLQALQQQTIDIITFASSKTVQYFYQLVQDKLPVEKLEKFIIASIGPQTSKTCQQLFGKVDIEATEYTLGGLSEAIVKYVENKQMMV
ncbi:uroporphyrinogen-III synthase [[Phormidium ambiguum] IAM M-71]|uniref:Uroporphyrinogen-III synthase n=1 Tax=[Phormidium ambiguum] IAM M-71 TaxID=454136 RepID=A0A1U7I6Y2_9CYAN|nr:uroporphyrinogen-III synthase [Phormidium ambiguum IAM M-71]